MKSIKLHDNEQAQHLLRNLDRMKSAGKTKDAGSTDKPKPASASPNSGSNLRPPPPPPKEFTPAEVAACKAILDDKCYYSILGVQKDCTETELKKAFRKKAVKVHPDRNNAPKATEAFQKVNAAMACLSDPAKRRTYD